MLQLRLLGEIDLRAADGRRLESVLAQPKRLALLSVLALAGGRLQRDELIGMFWPELPEDRARKALSQALHYLRRSLGPSAIEGKYETGIELDEGRLVCDAARLLEAVDAERWETAVELYRGELLPGFHLDDGPVEFERWITAERRRVRSAAAEAAWQVAERAVAGSDRVRAATLAQKAYEWSPWGEAALHRLLKVLDRIDDRAGALRAYREFTNRLEEEYNGRPSEATRQLVAEIESGPAAPERASAPPDVVAPPVEAATASAAQPVAAAWPDDGSTIMARLGRGIRPPVRPLRALATAAVVAAVFVASVPWRSSAAPAGSGASGASTVEEAAATLYLEPVRDLAFPDPSPGLAEAVTGELVAKLIETRGYRIMSGANGVKDAEGIEIRSTLRRDGADVRLAALLLDPVSRAVLDRVVVESEEPLDVGTPGRLASRMAAEIRKNAGGHLYLSRLADMGASAEDLAALREATRELAAADSLRLAGAREAAVLAFAAADSVLLRIQRSAPDWDEPALRRAELALRAVWLHLVPPHQDKEAAHQRIIAGLAIADSVVRTSESDARALETRGVLAEWAGSTAPNQELQAEYWASARADLQRAVGQEPGRARAWNSLSAMAERRGDHAEAYHSARRAYAADRDLRNEQDILARLFTSALEIGDTAGAANWCAEVHDVLPGFWLGSYCDLLHLAWAGPWERAVVDSLMEETRALMPSGPYGDYIGQRLELLRAVALAKGGERALAEAALSETGAVATPELLGLQAWAEAVLGREEDSRATLRRLAQMDPEAAKAVLRSRRFETLGYVVARSDY